MAIFVCFCFLSYVGPGNVDYGLVRESHAINNQKCVEEGAGRVALPSDCAAKCAQSYRFFVFQRTCNSDGCACACQVLRSISASVELIQVNYDFYQLPRYGKKI